MKAAGEDRDVMIAVTFAEAGEWQTARRYAPPAGARRAAASLRRRLVLGLERHLLAAALAEGALPDDALHLLRDEPPRAQRRPEDPLDALLRERGVRMSFGVLSAAALGAGR